jgi:hypothetical protein
VVAPHNSTAERYSLVSLRALARATGQVIIRWRLPLTATDNARSIINDVQAEEMPQLFGYFVKGVPVRLTQNSNTAIQLANGSPGILHAIALPKPHRRILFRAIRNGQFGAGDVYTLDEPPSGVFVKLLGLRPEARQALERAGAPRAADDQQPLIAFPSKQKQAKTRKLEFGHDSHGELVLYAHDPGYKIDLAGTIHGVQGDSTPWITAEFNAPVGMKAFSLSSVYVAASRVPAGSRFRVAPWNHAVGKAHLIDMEHNPKILRFLSCFDRTSGSFDLGLLELALQSYPLSETDQPRRRQVLPTAPLRSTRRRTAADAGLDLEVERNVRPRADVRLESAATPQDQPAASGGERSITFGLLLILILQVSFHLLFLMAR